MSRSAFMQEMSLRSEYRMRQKFNHFPTYRPKGRSGQSAHARKKGLLLSLFLSPAAAGVLASFSHEDVSPPTPRLCRSAIIIFIDAILAGSMSPLPLPADDIYTYIGNADELDDTFPQI